MKIPILGRAFAFGAWSVSRAYLYMAERTSPASASSSEITALRQWLAQPEQIRKLQDCLQSTVFDMGRVAGLVPEYGDVVEHDGETYITVRIPVSRRLGESKK